MLQVQKSPCKAGEKNMLSQTEYLPVVPLSPNPLMVGSLSMPTISQSQAPLPLQEEDMVVEAVVAVGPKDQ